MLVFVNLLHRQGGEVQTSNPRRCRQSRRYHFHQWVCETCQRCIHYSSQSLLHATVDKFLELNQLPHMLFYGPPGTGKTSTVLCIARKIYGDPGKSKSASNAYRNNVLEVCCCPAQSSSLNKLWMYAVHVCSVLSFYSITLSSMPLTSEVLTSCENR